MKNRHLSDKELIAALRREVKDLRSAYEEEKLAKEMYKKVIRIAEEQYDIPITKKSGVKQLRKDGGTTR
ncbi:MAG: hypothetical protein AAGM67_03140 [Bacteroidota bacterium]